MTQRFDLLILPQDRNLKIGEGAAASLIRFFAAQRVILPTGEAVAETWTEVHCGPGPSAHDGFMRRGTYDSDEEIFSQCVVRFGMEPGEHGYGGDPSYFWVEFRGCLFEQPAAATRERIHSLLHFRPHIVTRTASGELRPLPEVSEDDKPKDKRRKPSMGAGRAGTEVQEF